MKAVRRFNPEVGVRWSPSPFTGSKQRSTNTSCVMAYRQSCDHQSAAQTVLQPAKTKQRLGWFNQDEVEMVARDWA